MKRIFVAITGASGSVYGLRLVEELAARKLDLTLCISPSGILVAKEELGLDLSGDSAAAAERLKAHLKVTDIKLVGADDLFCSSASGSAAPDAMIVVPCSMGTLARIACGISTNLIERSADVMLKERRPLLLVPRETPLSEIHLENMLKLSRAGARMIPAMPGFYHHPQTVAEMVDFVVGKVFDQLGLENELYRRWGERAG